MHYDVGGAIRGERIVKFRFGVQFIYLGGVL